MWALYARRGGEPLANLEPPGPDENPILVAIDQPGVRILEQIAAVVRPARTGLGRPALTGRWRE
jgi:hypothetical protein